MHGVVTRAVEAVRGFAEETGTPLRLHLPVGVYAEVDPRRVERIVRNLVANAVDHGEGRPVDITLAGDDDAVAVVVRDHGVGLRPGEAALVFNRFWRAEESRARRSGGSGLGLSISIEDARLHGGWLQAWGEPGRGSAFRLTLPRDRRRAARRSSPLPLVPDDRAASEGVDAEPAPPSSTSDAAAGSVPTPVHGLPVVRAARRGPDASLPDRRRGPVTARALLVLLLVLAGLAGCASVPGELAGAGAAPRRRRRRAGAAARPGRRQQRAGPGPRLRLRLRQQPGPARRRPPLPRPRGRGVGRRHRRHRARRSSSTPSTPPRSDPEADMRTVRIRGTALGRLTPGGWFEAAQAPVQVDVNVVRRDGQWRIARLPGGVLVRMSDFRVNYRTVQDLVRGPGPPASPCRTCATCRARRRARRRPGRWSCCSPGRRRRCRARRRRMLVAERPAAVERRHQPGRRPDRRPDPARRPRRGRPPAARGPGRALARRGQRRPGPAARRRRAAAAGPPRPDPRRRRVADRRARSGDGARPGRLRRPGAPAQRAGSSTPRCRGRSATARWPCSRRRRARTGRRVAVVAADGPRRRLLIGGAEGAVGPGRSGGGHDDPAVVDAHRIRGVDGPGRHDGRPGRCSTPTATRRVAPVDAEAS